MAFVETWDETKPAGTRALNLGDDDLREFKRAIRERLAFGGMYFPSTDDALAGEHSYVRMAEQSSNPTAVSNKGFLFTKDVSGVTELYYMTDGGTAVQLTSGGKMLISSLVIASEARGDMIVRGASAWGRAAIGAAHRVWRSDGTDPSWAQILSLASLDELDGARLKTSGGNATNLSVTAPTAARTVTIPDANLNFTNYKEVVTGSYTGNGADNRDITVGFADTTRTPVFVLVFDDANGGAGTGACWFTGLTQGFRITDGSAQSTSIKSASANAFRVGTGAFVNTNAIGYKFIAIG